jgi:two-component system CheB/CheR fusion protein
MFEESRLPPNACREAREPDNSRVGGGLRHGRRGILNCHTATGIPKPNRRHLSGPDLASDISQTSIERARTGRYLENIAADVTDERLKRYFTKIEGGYQIREMCVFTKHNLFDDPPFSKLDLITCRNVLIYLGNVQKGILPLFHYALKPAGFLMLGASESAASGDLFSAVGGEHRIFTKRETSRKPHSFPAGTRGLRRAVPAGSPSAATASGLWDGVDVRKEVDRILLSKYSPAGVVVDDNLEVIEIRGKASPFLTLPAGKVSFNLIKLIPDTGLFLEVEKLIRKARKSRQPARREQVPYEQEGRADGLNVEVLPLGSSKKSSTLVLFEAVRGVGRARGRAHRPTRW